MIGKREILGAGLISVVVAGIAFATNAVGIPLCLFHYLTGFPCPGCGTTRACIALLKGHFADAVLLNPLAVMLVFIGSPLALIALRYSKGWNRKVVSVCKILAIPLILLNWAYLLYAAFCK